MQTQILCWTNFFSENYAVCEIMWKNTVETGRQYNTAHAHWMLDNYGHTRARAHTQTHRMLNACCFSMATVVSLSRLNVALYAHCVSCSFATLDGGERRSTEVVASVNVPYVRDQYSWLKMDLALVGCVNLRKCAALFHVLWLLTQCVYDVA